MSPSVSFRLTPRSFSSFPWREGGMHNPGEPKSMPHPRGGDARAEIMFHFRDPAQRDFPKELGEASANMENWATMD